MQKNYRRTCSIYSKCEPIAESLPLVNWLIYLPLRDLFHEVFLFWILKPLKETWNSNWYIPFSPVRDYDVRFVKITTGWSES